MNVMLDNRRIKGFSSILIVKILSKGFDKKNKILLQIRMHFGWQDFHICRSLFFIFNAIPVKY